MLPWIGAALGLLPVSLILFTYERALNPLYGSGPTHYTLTKVILPTFFASAVHPFRISTTHIWLYAALGLSLAPNATYWVAVWTSRKRDPIWGPAFTHAAVLAPLMFTWTTCVIEMGAWKSSQRRRPLPYRLLIAALCYAGGTLMSRRVWPNITYLNQVSESEIFLAMAASAYAFWILALPISITSSRRPRKKNTKPFLTPMQIKSALLAALLASWWTVYPHLSSPVLSHPLKAPYTHPEAPLQVLSSVQSTTGLIVVAQSLSPSESTVGAHRQEIHSARFLRASHSILGGVWIGREVTTLGDEPVVVDSFGAPLGDSVYSAFVLQEAVRLINSTESGRSGSPKNGLIIGLGAGISATAFQRHGISTTIVEIDPAVYDAARTFFGLPDPGPGKVFLEDARSWVATKRASIWAGNKEMMYDFVVHDCFSGGGVPEHIFTLEFWEDLKTILYLDGMVIVNFAGIPSSEPSRMVLHTLENSFDQCRALHDLFEPLHEDKYATEFVNIVFFCTSSKVPLTFRGASSRDFLGSPLRRHVLGDLSNRELKLEFIRDGKNVDKYILTDAHNALGKLQTQQSLHHWSIMREVLPNEHWETY